MESCMDTWFQYSQISIYYLLHREFHEFQIKNIIFLITYIPIYNFFENYTLYKWNTSIGQFISKHRGYKYVVKFVNFESYVEIKKKNNLIIIHI